MGVGGTVLEVTIVASNRPILIVPESPFLSPRRPTMSGQTCIETWWTKSNSISCGISIRSSVNPHLANSQSKLLLEAIVEVSLSMVQCLLGQY